MEKEFIGYNEALALKELGFNEPCFGFWDAYNGDSHLFFKPRIKYHWLIRLFKLIPNITTYNQDLLEYEEGDCAVLAPLYQQAFRWFREKYNFSSEINVYSTSDGYSYSFKILCKKYTPYIEANNNWLTYEEAELECLNKLIGLVKEKQ